MYRKKHSIHRFGTILGFKHPLEHSPHREGGMTGHNNLKLTPSSAPNPLQTRIRSTEQGPLLAWTVFCFIFKTFYYGNFQNMQQ